MTDSEGSTIHLPSREIAPPSSLSPEARALLSVTLPQAPPYPALDDKEGWRTRVAEQDAVMEDLIRDRVADAPVQVEEIEAERVPVYVITPDGTPADERRVLLSVHGGGFTGGAGLELPRHGHRRRVADGCAHLGGRLPDAARPPLPRPLDDCVAAYRTMLQEYRAEEIVVGGASAGGNLAAALILRARDEGLPLPAAAVLRTPEIDLTESGDSFQTNLGLDNLLTGEPAAGQSALRSGPRPAGPVPLTLVRRPDQGFPAHGPHHRYPGPVPVQHGALPPGPACGGHHGGVARPRGRGTWRLLRPRTRGQGGAA